jgi:hypothetical protein
MMIIKIVLVKKIIGINKQILTMENLPENIDVNSAAEEYSR